MSRFDTIKAAAAALTLGTLSMAVAPETASAQPACPAVPQVTIGSQAICGQTNSFTPPGGGTAASLNTFMGIPYASAARWQPPAAPNFGSNPFMATKPGSVCPQMQKGEVVGNENCLSLNVWAPASAMQNGAAKLPVLVFIHGGAYVVGAGSLPMYDGSSLASNGVVVVTLNYRLGAFGFLAADVPAGTGPNPAVNASIGGNFGLLDQQAALKWVQQNIGQFGGDAAQVTVVGESAGAMSVGMHLFAVPSSNSHDTTLFQAAIMESNPLGVQYRTASQAKAEGANFVEKLCKQNMAKPDQNCPSHATYAWLSDTKALTTAAIVTAQKGFLGGKTGDASGGVTGATNDDAVMSDVAADGAAGIALGDALPWAPNVDGTFVVGQPAAGYNGTRARPFAIGVNSDEGVPFAAMIANAAGVLEPFEYNAILKRVFNPTGATPDTVKRIQDYKVGKSAPYNAPQPDRPSYYDGTAKTVTNLINDFAFRCATLWTVNQATAQASTPVYGYYFSQLPAFDLYQRKNDLGKYVDLAACDKSNGNVCHANELPYVFNTVAVALAKDPEVKDTKPSPRDGELARAMNIAWASFAKNPNSPGDSWNRLNGTGAPILYRWSNPSPGHLPVSTLDQQSNCSAFWFKQSVYPTLNGGTKVN